MQTRPNSLRRRLLASATARPLGVLLVAIAALVAAPVTAFAGDARPKAVISTASRATAAAMRTASPGRIALVLNRERAANGLYSQVGVNPDWSAKCRTHNAYMRLNNIFDHAETPGTPGYTDEGNWAGTHAVLAKNASFRDGDPYEWAPYHLLQLLHPALRTIGADESRGYGCVTTFPGYDPAPVPADALSSWPGNGRRDAPWFEVASELPTIPGAGVGLPEGSVTGPNIMLYWQGPVADATYDPNTGQVLVPPMPPLDELTSATLTGPGGSVIDTRLVAASRDPHTVPGTGFVIPVQPLKTRADYVLNATFSTDPATCGSFCRSFSGTVSFHTMAANFRKIVKVSAKRVRSGGRPAIAVTTRMDQLLPSLRSVRCSIGTRRFRCPTTNNLTILTLPIPRSMHNVPVTVRVPSFRIGSVRVRGGIVRRRVR